MYVRTISNKVHLKEWENPPEQANLHEELIQSCASSGNHAAKLEACAPYRLNILTIPKVFSFQDCRNLPNQIF